MKKNIVIKVENLTKIYHLYDQPQDRLKEALNPFRKSYHKDFYALNNVSFEIKKGETVGVIGKNGAGKSTLLKMITGVLTPSSGNLEVHGNISSLLELGAGFNPELTGYENIYLNGSIIGLTDEEIDSKIDAILEFADIGNFIYQPVKSYSSGMYARLAFAISINVEPDILIVDEILSVGDMNFQAKCMTAMERIKGKGTTILFVSHNIDSVKSLCDKAIYIKNGSLISRGKAGEVADLYIKEMREISNKENKNLIKDKKVTLNNLEKSTIKFKSCKEFDKRVNQFRYGTGELKVSYVELVNLKNEPIYEVEFNQNVKIRIYVQCFEDIKATVNFQILDDKRINIVASSFRHVGKGLMYMEKEKKYFIEYRLKLPLQMNNYSIQAVIGNHIVPDITVQLIDVVPDSYIFQVKKRPNATLWSKVDLFPDLVVSEIINDSSN